MVRAPDIIIQWLTFVVAGIAFNCGIALIVEVSFASGVRKSDQWKSFACVTSAKLTNEIVAVFVIEVAGLSWRNAVHVVVELWFYRREEVSISNDDGFSHADRACNGWLVGMVALIYSTVALLIVYYKKVLGLE